MRAFCARLLCVTLITVTIVGIRTMTHHVLYSFRRCPYAMRARLALRIAGVDYELREVDLKNKPTEMLELSPKGTVPVLHLQNGVILEESLDVVDWCLDQYAEHFQSLDDDQLNEQQRLIDSLQSFFVPHLHRYKYPDRHDLEDGEDTKQPLDTYLGKLERQLEHSDTPYLFGPKFARADLAIFPMIRQMRGVSEAAFEAGPYDRVIAYTHRILDSEVFKDVMFKTEPWSPGQALVLIRNSAE